MKMKVGVARKIITPKIGARLYGYRTDVYSKSINDDLTATAIAFSSGEEMSMMFSLTVCLIDEFLCEEIREKIYEVTNIPMHNIIISATHTHSGPCLAGNSGWGDIDSEYYKTILLPNVLDAAREALENMQDASMGIGTTKSEVGINRREVLIDNTVAMTQNPWGCFDPNMTLLSFKNKSGDIIANIIHYGAHCTAAGCNVEITRDWAGVMVDRVEKITGGITMFFNGAEGDVGPRLSNGLTVGNIEYVNELGGIAATDAMKAYNSITEYKDVEFGVITDDLSLPYDDVISLEEAQKNVDELESYTRENLAGRLYYHYVSIVDYYNGKGKLKDYYTFKQTIVKVGPVIFVPFPFEVFSEISLRLRKYCKYPYVLSLSCTNGNNGYLPSSDQICRGGYEVQMFKSFDMQSLVEDTDSKIIQENLRIIEKIENVVAGSVK